jgi:hypothetical protein
MKTTTHTDLIKDIILERYLINESVFKKTNNPYGLSGNIKWLGADGVGANNVTKFKNPLFGVRAGYINLNKFIDKHKPKNGDEFYVKYFGDTEKQQKRYVTFLGLFNKDDYNDLMGKGNTLQIDYDIIKTNGYSDDTIKTFIDTIDKNDSLLKSTPNTIENEKKFLQAYIQLEQNNNIKKIVQGYLKQYDNLQQPQSQQQPDKEDIGKNESDIFNENLSLLKQKINNNNFDSIRELVITSNGITHTYKKSNDVLLSENGGSINKLILRGMQLGRLSKDSINNDLLKNVLSSKISVDVKLKTEKTIYNNERVESNKVILKDIKEDIESVDNKNVITINNDKGDHIFNIYKVSPKRYIMFRFFNQSGEDMYIEKFNNLDFLDKIKLSSQSISNDSPISIGNNIKKFINKMSVSNKNLFLSYVNTKK